MKCSGNYLWRRSIPITKGMPWTWQLILDQLVYASLLSRTWKSWIPSTNQQWLRATLQPVYTLQPLVTTRSYPLRSARSLTKVENNFHFSNSEIHLFHIDILIFCLISVAYQTDWRVFMCLRKEGFVIWGLVVVWQQEKVVWKDTVGAGLRCWHWIGSSRDGDCLKRPWVKRGWAPLFYSMYRSETCK